MPDQQRYLELRFAGDTDPSDFRAKDVARALRNFEDLVLETLRETEDDIDLDDVVVGLVEVHRGSNGLRFRSSYMSRALAAFAALGAAVQEKQYEDLTDTQRDALRGIQSVGEKYNSPTQLRSGEDSEEELLGVLETDDVIPEAETVKGHTTVYGTVERVGGKTKPKVHVRIGEGEKIIVEVGEERARDLAGHLYDDVYLEGEAVWLMESGKIESFELEKIIESDTGGLSEGLNKLSEVVGEDYDNVDPIEFTRRIRGSEGPETLSANE
jgi:hypothetical protein